MNLRDDETTIQNLLDGKLGEAEFIRIEQRLAEDAGFRSLYLSYAKSHHLLIERFEASGIQACVASPGPIVLCRRRMAMALAAVLTALATAGALFQVLKKEPSAQLVFGPETGARLDHPEGKAGGDRMWPGSSLELDRGSISLVMPSGVRGYIEGPGRLEMESPTKLVLRSGRAWFDVPEGAEGFVCATESLFVEDLGTQFGVIADPGRPEQLREPVELLPDQPPGLRPLVRKDLRAAHPERPVNVRGRVLPHHVPPVRVHHGEDPRVGDGDREHLIGLLGPVLEVPRLNGVPCRRKILQRLPFQIRPVRFHVVEAGPDGRPVGIRRLLRRVGGVRVKPDDRGVRGEKHVSLHHESDLHRADVGRGRAL